MHVFINESYIGVSLFGFGDVINNQGVDINALWEKTKIVKELLKEEFVIEFRMQTFEDFKKVVEWMVQENILAYTLEGKIWVSDNPNTFEFVCNLIFPIIDTYWIVIMYAYQLGLHYFCEENRLYE